MENEKRCKIVSSSYDHLYYSTRFQEKMKLPRQRQEGDLSQE